MHQPMVLWAACLLLTAGLWGCGSSESSSNFDRATNGMSLAEVEHVLGPGEQRHGATVLVVLFRDDPPEPPQAHRKSPP
jgi:hypothetical protein